MLRWKRRKREGSPWETTQFVLRDTVTGTIVAAVQQMDVGKWFWYTLRSVGPAMNSCKTPVKMAEAKAECMKYVKEHRQDGRETKTAATADPVHER